MLVPWNASWSSEDRYEIRPCRWAGGRNAVWQPHTPGDGRPIFAKPHNVRQRQSVSRFLCTVCGKETPANDRWWFSLGRITDGYFMTTEAPVHRCCADLALKVCPHLRGRSDDLSRFPSGYSVMQTIVGGPSMQDDFGLNIVAGRTVVGHLKFAWPMHAVKFKVA
jgi:hypothetical protein